MREIKFRGKTRYGGEWVYGYYSSIEIYKQTAHFITKYARAETVNSIIRIKTIGQFTGAYDCTKWEELTPAEQAAYLASKKGNAPETWKGKEIYEGDVVSKKILVVGEIKGVVVFGKKSYGFGVHAKLVSYGQTEDKFYRLKKSDKIIGNIHDNPELLPAHDTP